MKKLLSALLALAMLLTALCGAMAEEVDVTGEWILSRVRVQGAEADPSALGMEITMNLNADGSATVNALGSEESGKWYIEDGKCIVDDGASPLALTLIEGRLESDDLDGITMVFVRAGEAAASVALRTGVALADFNGCWDGAEVEMMGVCLPLETAGMAMYLEIADGHVAYSLTVGEEIQTGEGEAVQADDGLLLGVGEDAMLLNLLEDGRLLFSYTSDGLGINIYLNRVEGD